MINHSLSLEVPCEQHVDQSDLLISLTTEDTPYLCPGETLAINRAVHLARLKSHYRKCKECPHRQEAEIFSSDAHQLLEDSWNHEPRPQDSLRDGFGSQFLNQFPAKSGRQLSQAFASLLWEQKTTQSSKKLTRNLEIPTDNRPTIVMGHDFAEASLEMMRESVRGVREQGCRVIDAGGITAAGMMFVLENLQADAGIHATSRRENCTSAGIDLYGSNAIPLSGESLHEVQNFMQQKSSRRYSRSDGGLTPYPARKDYLGSLWKHFRGIRPFRIWINTANELTIDYLNELFQDLPGELIFSKITLPNNSQESAKNELLEQECDLGLILDPQSQSCTFLDASGTQITASEILSILYQQIKQVHSSRPDDSPLVMLGEELQTEEILKDASLHGIVRHRQSLREYFARGMVTAKTPLGFDACNRYWFAEPTPICDGIVTLGKVLQAFSAS